VFAALSQRLRKGFFAIARVLSGLHADGLIRSDNARLKKRSLLRMFKAGSRMDAGPPGIKLHHVRLCPVRRPSTGNLLDGPQ
jgi:hypothetical protein